MTNTDWGEIAEEIEEDTDFDVSKPVLFSSDDFSKRTSYPKFDANGDLEEHLIEITKNYLLPLGVEFGLRSIRQSRNYLDKYQEHFDIDTDVVLNHVVRQKILPKMMFDGTKKIDETTERKDVLENLQSYLIQVLDDTKVHEQDNAIQDLQTTLKNAEINDWVVNYWFR